MGKAISPQKRKENYIHLNKFLDNNPKLDVVVWSDKFGCAIFWGVSYCRKFNNNIDDPAIELSINWDTASNIIDYIPISELPNSNSNFSTKYNRFSKALTNFGPVSFDTGNGYRHFIRFNMFGHYDSKNHIDNVYKCFNDMKDIC